MTSARSISDVYILDHYIGQVKVTGEVQSRTNGALTAATVKGKTLALRYLIRKIVVA